MIESTKKKFQKTNDYITSALEMANLSEEIVASIEMEASLNRLNNGVFKIAVVAPFSAGKSTFINSLLGFDLLSTSILVETAAITTVKYAEQPRAEINYRDGSQEVVHGDPDDLFGFKNGIKRYTAVNREDDEFEVETSIRSVDVYWPIELCKSGVEIVDTPGLFAQYEAHSGITSNILKSVNAVIFIIDPTTVGEVNFMNVIRQYVENAKSTTMDNSDKHIFFAVNKIDQYPEGEVEKAYLELRKVLEGVVMAPKIFKVSSYFGLITKMYEDGHIDLNDIRRDGTIRFVDDEGFPVAGRAIQETDVPTIKRISNIQSVYESLGIYFEEKNGYLISEVFQKLNRALQLEIESIEKVMQIEEKRFKDDKGMLKEQAENLTEIFKKEITTLKMTIEDLLENRMNDQQSSKSITNKIRNLYNNEVPGETENLFREIKREWRKASRKITKNNAAEIIDSFFSVTDLKLENSKQQTNQKSFAIINKNLEAIINSCEELIGEMEQNFNRLFEVEFGILQSKNSFFNFEELVEELHQELVQIFKGNAAKEISDSIGDDLGDIKRKNTTIRQASGFLNKIKSLFGKEDYVTEFELNQFVDDIFDEIDIALDELEAELTESLRQMLSTLMNRIDTDLGKMIQNHLLDSRLTNYKRWQEKQLDTIASNEKQSKEQFEASLIKYEIKLALLQSIEEDTRKKFDEISNSMEEELVG